MSEKEKNTPEVEEKKRKTTIVPVSSSKGGAPSKKSPAQKKKQSQGKKEGGAKKKKKLTKKELWKKIGLGALIVVGVVTVALLILIPLMNSGKDKGLYDENYVYDGTSLVGKWQEKELDEKLYFIYELKDDGKATKTVYTFGIETEKFDGSYEVKNNNELILTYSDEAKETYSFSITDDGILVFMALGEMGYEELHLVDYDLEFNSRADIVGTWYIKDNQTGSRMIFNADQTGLIDDDDPETTSNQIKYGTKNNKLYVYMVHDDLVLNTSPWTFEYSVNGDTLTLIARSEDKTETLVLERR